MKQYSGILMALALATFAPICAEAQQVSAKRMSTVAVAEAAEVQNDVFRRYPGRVVSLSEVSVTSRVSGDLLEVAFKEGQFVKKGDLLYRLDDIRYVAAEKSAEAKVAQYKARVAYSKANYDRTEQLFKKDVSTQDELDSALSEYNANLALLAAAEADLIVAKDDLKNTRIYAPSDGMVGFNNVPEGTYVTPSSGTLTKVVRFNPIRVRFAYSNRDFLQMFGSAEEFFNAKLNVVLADGNVYPVQGKIDFVDNAANASTDTVYVYVLFDNNEYKLVPGATVSVVLTKNAGKSVAVLPSAMLYDKDGAYVYVLDENNVPARRDVKIANEAKDWLFIAEGLNAGERVVVDGTHKVVPGQAVNAVSPEK